MSETTKPSALRAWLRFVAEFPEYRWDLQAKWEYFAGWKVCHGR